MKRKPTKYEWDELSLKQKKIFWETIFGRLEDINILIDSSTDFYKAILGEIPDIGYILEFLGDDWFVIRNNITGDKIVEAKPFGIGQGYEKKEVVDALFSAVKYKIKQLEV